MDKGVGCVIIDEKDYYEKLDLIVNDNTRFTKLNYKVEASTIKEGKTAPWIEKEKQVIYYCSTYLKSIVDKSTYWRVYPQGSQPGRLYGMAKIHKPNCPMRPVLSAIGTPEYSLAKWLEDKLKPYLVDPFSVKSSALFIEELSTIKPNPSDICVSFDIKSLYTNVPLKEVIKDIITVVYDKSAKSSFFQDNKISKTVLKNMLIHCSEPIFLYKQEVYKQSDGVAMGSPLAPLLANWFVSKIEKNILSDIRHRRYKPTLYRRYVDDVFAVFRSHKDRDEFFEVLNKAHKNLKFTMESSTTNNMLPFLDISISIQNETFTTKVYRKPSNTHILMNYKCVAPTKWKSSLVKCLLNKDYRISSSHEFFIEEVAQIETILTQNDYPKSMFQNVIKDFVEFHNIDSENFKANVKKPDESKQHDTTEKVFFTIPYLGKPSIRLQNHIKKEIKNYGVVITAAYKTTKVSNYFSLKTRCPDLFTSNVIYKFTCSQNETISYIGETRRQLFRRAEEHLKTDKSSAVFEHISSCEKCQNSNNIMESFKIIKLCSPNNILTFEAMMIANEKPILNIQLGPGKGTLTSLTLY